MTLESLNIRRHLGGFSLMLCLVVGMSTQASAESSSGLRTEGPTVSLTLHEAMEMAAQQNPSVLLSKERIEAARGEVTTQLGAMLPNLSGNARQSKQTQFLGTYGLSPVRTDPFDIFDARVSASQNLFSLSLIQRWRASRETLHGAEFDADAGRFDTMASAALAYLEGLKATSAVTMRQATQQLIQDLLLTTKRRHKEGVVTALDVARLEGQLAHERQQVISAQADVERATNTLRNLLSLPSDVRIVLSDTLRRDHETAQSYGQVLDEAIAHRPEVQAQFKRIKAAALTYSSITGERLPSLVAQGDTGLVGNRWNSTTETYNMALVLQIPLFDGGQREGRVATARSHVRQEELRLRIVLNQVEAEVTDAQIAFDAAQEKVALAEAGLQAATREATLARERYAVLTAANQFDVITAVASVARARENMVTALFELNGARVNQARATGTMAALY
ncbi:MAG: TolC family protein [Nitrospiraceae bacterium]